MSDEEKVWRANPGPQENFLACTAYECLYGGAAGGGKSIALLMAPLRWIGHPSFNGILFRRTFPELEGHIIPKSKEIYPIVGGEYNNASHVWTFPSGARISFGHLQHEDDVYRYIGVEFQYIGFDELTQFTERMYTYLLSRGRSAHGLPIRIRSTSNPGGEGHEWVLKRWSPWLEGLDGGRRAKPGEVLSYINSEEGERWIDTHNQQSLSRCFIPATIADNPHLAESDPLYTERLKGLDRVTREQLLHGNWLVKAGRGALFKRQWFTMSDAPPREVIARVRHWDLAASVEGYDKKGKPTDPDWTVGLKMSYDSSGIWHIEHIHRFRGRPSEVKETILSYANKDGLECQVSLPIDPGQAGVAQAEDYSRALVGYVFRTQRESGEKFDRAKPVSAQVEFGNFRVIRGSWNDAFFDEAESFPEGKKDQIDALSGAFNSIISGGYVTLGEGPITSGVSREFEPPPVGYDDDWGDDNSRYGNGSRR